MRKILLFLLFIILGLCLAACVSNIPNPTANDMQLLGEVQVSSEPFAGGMSVHLTGRIKNPSKVKLDLIRINFTLYGDNNKIIGTTYDAQKDIDAGTIWIFNTYCTIYENSKSLSHTITISYNPPKNNTGEIVGGVFASIAIVGTIIFIVYYQCKKREKFKQYLEKQQQNNENVLNAKTMKNYSYNRQSQFDVGEDMGLFLLKRWISTFDDKTREAHRLANGQTVPNSMPFIVGGEKLMHPHDENGSPQNIDGCRCCTVAEIVTKKQYNYAMAEYKKGNYYSDWKSIE